MSYCEPYLKTAGVTFTKKQLREIASNILGDEYKPTYVPSGVFSESRGQAKVGKKLVYFHPDVVKRNKDTEGDGNKLGKGDGNANANDKNSKRTYDIYKDDNVPCYMFVLVIEELVPGETLAKFYDIKFEERKDDPEVKPALEWLKKYGFTNEEQKERWATRSEWSFRKYVDSW